jgi:hypothetical protein
MSLALEGLTQGRRHSGAVGLFGHSRMVLQEPLKRVHDLAPFLGLAGRNRPAFRLRPRPGESAGESAGDHFGEHLRSWVAFLPT